MKMRPCRTPASISVPYGVTRIYMIAYIHRWLCMCAYRLRSISIQNFNLIFSMLGSRFNAANCSRLTCYNTHPIGITYVNPFMLCSSNTCYWIDTFAKLRGNFTTHGPSGTIDHILCLLVQPLPLIPEFPLLPLALLLGRLEPGPQPSARTRCLPRSWSGIRPGCRRRRAGRCPLRSPSRSFPAPTRQDSSACLRPGNL